MTRREYAEQPPDTLPLPGQVGCDTFWGSHGCSLIAAHLGDHVCYDVDETGAPVITEEAERTPADDVRLWRWCPTCGMADDLNLDQRVEPPQSCRCGEPGSS